MNRQTGFPWVNLWMLAFSVGGIWLVWHTLADTQSTHVVGITLRREETVQCYGALTMLLVVALTALWRMPTPFAVAETESPEPTLTQIGRLYHEAWKSMLSQKWVLVVFGALALIHVVEGTIGQVMYVSLVKSRAPDTGELLRSAIQPSVLAHYLQGRFGVDVAIRTAHSPAWFFWPITAGGSPSTRIAAPLVVISLLPWLRRHLRRLGEHPSFERTARQMLTLLPVTGVLAVMGVAAYLAEWHNAMSGMHSTRSVDPFALAMAPARLWEVFFSLTVLPFLFGGVAGSLVRSTDGGFVNADTLVRDGVRNLRPLMAFMVMFTVATALAIAPGLAAWGQDTSRLPEWLQVYHPLCNQLISVAKMLLIFVPYAIVRLGIGSLRGLKIGLSDWVSHAGTVLQFVTLGITIVVPLLVVRSAVGEMLRESSIWSVIVGFAFQVTNALLSAWLAVAVWELYRRIGRRPVPQEKSPE